MKNLDKKKMIVLAVLLIIVVLGTLFIFKGINNSKNNKETLEKYQDITINYYLNLTKYYNTNFNGIDRLYLNDETKVTDLEEKALIGVAIDYIKATNSATKLDTELLKKQYKGRYLNLETATFYSAKDIRNTIKELFGITAFSNPTIENDYDYQMNYIYLAEEDIYIVHEKETIPSNQTIEHSIIKTEFADNKIITTYAIAYVNNDGNKKQYAKDRIGRNIISTDADKFPTEKIDKFEHYKITLNKTKDGNYVFESIKKVK